MFVEAHYKHFMIVCVTCVIIKCLTPSLWSPRQCCSYLPLRSRRGNRAGGNCNTVKGIKTWFRYTSVIKSLLSHGRFSNSLTMCSAAVIVTTLRAFVLFSLTIQRARLWVIITNSWLCQGFYIPGCAMKGTRVVFLVGRRIQIIENYDYNYILQLIWNFDWKWRLPKFAALFCKRLPITVVVTRGSFQDYYRQYHNSCLLWLDSGAISSLAHGVSVISLLAIGSEEVYISFSPPLTSLSSLHTWQWHHPIL